MFLHSYQTSLQSLGLGFVFWSYRIRLIPPIHNIVYPLTFQRIVTLLFLVFNLPVLICPHLKVCLHRPFTNIFQMIWLIWMMTITVYQQYKDMISLHGYHLFYFCSSTYSLSILFCIPGGMPACVSVHQLIIQSPYSYMVYFQSVSRSIFIIPKST